MSIRRILVLLILVAFGAEMTGCGIVRIRRNSTAVNKEEKKQKRKKAREKNEKKIRTGKAARKTFERFKDLCSDRSTCSVLKTLNDGKSPATKPICMKRRGYVGPLKRVHTKGKCDRVLQNARALHEICQQGVDSIRERWTKRRRSRPPIDTLCSWAATAEADMDRRVVALSEFDIDRFIQWPRNLSMMIAFHSRKTPAALLEKGKFPLMKWRNLEFSKAFVRAWAKRYKQQKSEIVRKSHKKHFKSKMRYPAGIKAVRASMGDRYGKLRKFIILSAGWTVNKRQNGMPKSRYIKGHTIVRLKKFHPTLCVYIPWSYVEDFDLATMKYKKATGAHIDTMGVYVHCR